MNRTPLCSRHILFLRRIIVAYTFSLLATTNALSQESEYPKTWPRPHVATDHDCVPLTGYYQYVGENINENLSSDKYYMTMAYAFGGYAPIDEDRNVYQYATVEINLSKEGRELRAIVFADEAHLKSSILLLEVSCMNGWWVSEHVTSRAAEGTRGSYKSEVKIAMAMDDSIIIYNKDEGTTSAFFGLFPSPFKYETWFRFLPATRTEKGAREKGTEGIKNTQSDGNTNWY